MALPPLFSADPLGMVCRNRLSTFMALLLTDVLQVFSLPEKQHLYTDRVSSPGEGEMGDALTRLEAHRPRHRTLPPRPALYP